MDNYPAAGDLQRQCSHQLDSKTIVLLEYIHTYAAWSLCNINVTAWQGYTYVQSNCKLEVIAIGQH